jgi:hypothetical protein
MFRILAIIPLTNLYLLDSISVFSRYMLNGLSTPLGARQAFAVPPHAEDGERGRFSFDVFFA